MDQPNLKHCPICNQDLPVSDFGVCRARRDGKNLYCRACINAKVTQSRRALKAYKEARKKYIAQQVEIFETEDFSVVPVGKLSPVDRVRLAIQRGARTQREIVQQAKLGKDEVSDAIAHLLLWTHEIETKSDGDNRYYFILNTVEQPKRKDCALSLSCFGPVIKHERVA